MGRSLLIAGVERWQDYERDTLSMERGLTYTADTCSFELRGTQPNTGDSVVISEDGVDLYGGIIIKCDYLIKLDKSVSWAIECDDYSAILSRMLVVEVYETQTAQYIIEDIITKYVDSSFTSSIAADSPTIEKLVFDYVPVAEAFKQICDYIGWSWLITPAKMITFFNPQVLLTAAPMTIEPGALFTNMKYGVDQSSIRNRVYVKGGQMDSSTLTYEWKTDGVARQWPLPFIIKSVSALAEAGSTVTYGEDGVADELTVDYVYHITDQRLACTAGTSTPADGTTMHMEYIKGIDVITMAEDLSSQAALAAILGNDGVFEYVIADTSLVTLEAAEAAGQADIKENGNPKTTGSFDTTVTGWEPGQIVTISLPLRGIDNTFMVQKVAMRPRPMAGWDVTVSFGGRLLGVADFLAALINDQKSVAISSTATVMKYVYGDETVAVADVLYTTSRTTPFVIEESASGVVSTV